MILAETVRARMEILHYLNCVRLRKGDLVEIPHDFAEWYFQEMGLEGLPFDFGQPGVVHTGRVIWNDVLPHPCWTMSISQRTRKYGDGGMPIPIRYVKRWNPYRQHEDLPEEQHVRKNRL